MGILTSFPPPNLPTPLLVLRMDRVRANLAQMNHLLGKDISRWQPHLKTTKMPVVWQLLLENGVRRFKCATIREAQVLLDLATAQNQSIELLVALSHHGRNLESLAGLAELHPHHSLSLLSEDPEHARGVLECHPKLGLWLDLDPGDRRSGIPMDQHNRILETVRAMGNRWQGLHFYEGGERQVNLQQRQKACMAHYERLLQVRKDLLEAGFEAPALMTSGTPAFSFALACTEFRALDHRVSPGTLVFFDGKSEEFDLDGFLPAATVLTRVISRPDDGHFTCDAGSKAVDAATPDPVATVVGHPEWQATRPSEEHLPFLAGAGDAPPTGTLLELIPYHICPTVNLAEEALLLDKENILGQAPVSARAHSVSSEP